jgi:sulfur carrier protein
MLPAIFGSLAETATTRPVGLVNSMTFGSSATVNGHGSEARTVSVALACTERWGPLARRIFLERGPGLLPGSTLQGISGSLAEMGSIPPEPSAISTIFGSTSPELRLNRRNKLKYKRNEATSMKLKINGEERVFNEAIQPFTLTALIENLGMKSDRVAVELNRDIVPRDRWAATELREGDRLEIVHFVGGGTRSI